MIGNMLCEYNEGDRYICHRDRADVCGGKFLESAESGKEGKVGDCKEGRERYLAIIEKA